MAADTLCLGDELCSLVDLPLEGEELGQVDREEDELVVEISGTEVLPELGIGVLGFRELPEVAGDAAFEPVEPQLPPLAGDCA